jgi:hypothetical protein
MTVSLPTPPSPPTTSASSTIKAKISIPTPPPTESASDDSSSALSTGQIVAASVISVIGGLVLVLGILLFILRRSRRRRGRQASAGSLSGVVGSSTTTLTPATQQPAVSRSPVLSSSVLPLPPSARPSMGRRSASISQRASRYSSASILRRSRSGIARTPSMESMLPHQEVMPMPMPGSSVMPAQPVLQDSRAYDFATFAAGANTLDSQPDVPETPGSIRNSPGDPVLPRIQSPGRSPTPSLYSQGNSIMGATAEGVNIRWSNGT